MAEVLHINVDQARNNPEEVFTNPSDVAREVGLTRGQKLATLKRWGDLVQLRLDAANEGMTAPADEEPADAELLRTIGVVIEQLKSNEASADEN